MGVVRSALNHPVRVSEWFRLAAPDRVPTGCEYARTASSESGDHLVLCHQPGKDSGTYDIVAVAVHDGKPIAVDGVALDLWNIDAPPSTVRAGSGWLVAANAKVVTLDAAGALVATHDLPFTARGFAWGGDRALVVSNTGQAQFVKANGELLGGVFTIPTGPKPVTGGGTVAFDGTHFLVEYAASGVTLSSVSLDGKTAGPTFAFDSTAVDTGAQLGTGPIASDGQGFLVTYVAPPQTCGYGGSCTPVTWRYRMASVQANGHVVLDIARTAGSAYASPPRVVYAGGSYLAYWSGSSTLLINPSGTAIGPATALDAIWQATPSYAFIGYDVAASPDGQSLLWLTGFGVQRLSPSFELLDAAAAAIVTSPLPQELPSAVFDGGAFAATWTDNTYSVTRGTRLSPSDSHPERWPYMVDGNASHTLLASTGSSVLGVKYGTPTLLSLLGPNGEQDLDVASLGFQSVDPYAATDGSSYLVAGIGPSNESYATVLSSSGVASPSVTLPFRDSQPLPVFDGENYMVLTGGGNPYVVQRISPSGEQLDATPQPLTTGAYPGRALASNGEGSLFAWIGYDGGGSYVYAAHVSRAGELEPPAGYVLGRPGPSGSVGAVWDGINYIVLFPDETGTALAGRRIAPDARTVVDEFIAFPGSSSLATVAANNTGDTLAIVYGWDHASVLEACWISEGALSGSGGSTGGTTGASGGAAGEHNGGTGARSDGGATGTGAEAGDGNRGGGTSIGGKGGGRSNGGEPSNAGAPSHDGGEGGDATEGGAPSHGGSAPHGGKGGEGTAGHSGGGASGRAGAGAGGALPDDDGSCSCRVVPRTHSDGTWWLGVVGVGLGVVARRRRRSQQGRLEVSLGGLGHGGRAS